MNIYKIYELAGLDKPFIQKKIINSKNFISDNFQKISLKSKTFLYKKDIFEIFEKNFNLIKISLPFQEKKINSIFTLNQKNTSKSDLLIEGIRTSRKIEEESNKQAKIIREKINDDNLKSLISDLEKFVEEQIKPQYKKDSTVTLKDFLSNIGSKFARLWTTNNLKSPFSETLILKQYLKLTLSQSCLDEKDKINIDEKYRNNSVGIYDGNVQIDEGIKAELIEEDILKLNSWMNDDNDINVLLKGAIFHFLFIYIHPYYDGNGRMGRTLHDFSIRKLNNPSLTNNIVYLSQVIRITKSYYYGSIRDTRETSDLSYFLSYILYCYKISQTLMSIDEKFNFELSEIEKEFLLIYLVRNDEENGIPFKKINLNLTENISNQRISEINQKLLKKNLIILHRTKGRLKFYKFNNNFEKNN